jgi:hypothetical protein
LTLIAHEIDNIFTPELMDGFISNGSLPQGLDVEVRKVLGAIDNKSGNYGGYKAPSDKDLLSGYMNQLQVLRGSGAYLSLSMWFMDPQFLPE